MSKLPLYLALSLSSLSQAKIEDMFLEAVGGWILEYRYWVLLPITVVEGPIIMTISGFLLKLGYFNFWPLYLVLMAGDLTADVIWYLIGFHGGRPLIKKYGYWLSITDKLMDKTEASFHKYQNKILFISKITMGLGFAPVILMTAGISRVPFRKYLTFNFFGQFIWTGFLMAIGYFFGNLYLVINKGLRTVSLVAFGLIVVLAVYGVNRYLRLKNAQEKV